MIFSSISVILLKQFLCFSFLSALSFNLNQKRSTTNLFLKSIASNTENVQQSPKNTFVEDPRAINRVITSTFTRMHFNSSVPIDLEKYLSERLTSVNQINVLTLMHRCGKYKLDVFKFLEPSFIFQRLCSIQISPQGISNALYGLQNMNIDSPWVTNLLEIFISQIRGCHERFDGQCISNSLYGLRGMTSKNKQVRTLLALFHEKIQEHNNIQKTNTSQIPNPSPTGLIMKSQGLGMAFYGLRSMTSNEPEVRLIIKSLAGCIATCSTELDCQAFANCLEGIKGCTDECPEALLVLKNLATYLAEFPQVLSTISSKEFSMALHGLQGMDSRNSVVTQFLDVLCRILESNTNWNCINSIDDIIESHYFSPQSSNRNNNNNNNNNEIDSEASLTNPVCKAKGLHWSTLTASELASALFGLRKMSSYHPAVRNLLGLLTKAICARESQQKKIITDLNNAMKKNDDSYVTRKILSLEALEGFKRQGLQRLPSSGADRLGRDNSYHRKELVILKIKDALPTIKTTLDESSLSNALYGLQSMSCDHEEVRMMLGLLAEAQWCRRITLSGRGVSTALHGLQGCKPHSEEVKLLLNGLTLGLQLYNGVSDYNARHIAMALYGLQRATGSGSKEEAELLMALAQRIETSPWPLHGQDAAIALYGLQSMSADVPAVRRLLAALARRLTRISSSGPLLGMSGRGVAMAVHGIRGLSDKYPEVQELLTQLSYHIDSSTGTGTVLVEGAELVTAIRGLKSVTCRCRAGSASGASEAAAATIEGGQDPVLGTTGSGSGSGRGVRRKREQQVFENVMDDPDDVDESTDRFTTSTSTRTTGSMEEVAAAAVSGSVSVSGSELLLRSMAGILSRKGRRRMTPAEACRALYGLQSLSADIPAAVSLLEAIVEDMSISLAAAKSAGSNSDSNSDGDRYIEPLTGKDIANALYGIHSFHIPSQPLSGSMQELLTLLAQLIDETPMPLTATAISNGFYGLQRFHSETPEVRAIIAALTNKINPQLGSPSTTTTASTSTTTNTGGSGGSLPSSEYQLTGQHIGNALWGLRRMNAGSVEVRLALLKLAECIRMSAAQMNGQNIGNALFGLQGMNSDVEEVRSVLGALAHKIVASSCSLSGRDAGMALFGLRGMDSGTVEVRVILGALLHKLQQSDAKFGIGDLGRAIVGILRAKPWIRDDFLSLLATKTPGMTYLNHHDDTPEYTSIADVAMTTTSDDDEIL